MPDWYRISKIYVGIDQVRPSNNLTVQTFDFQNDGDLGWTAQTVYGTPTYVSWEWWTLPTTGTSDRQSVIMPPSSVYSWWKAVLHQVKLRIYKWYVKSDSLPDQWAWIWNSTLSRITCWSQSWSNSSQLLVNDWSSHFFSTIDGSGECVLTYTFNNNWDLVFSINWTAYIPWSYGSIFRGLWTSSNLWIAMGNWRNTSNFYVRKCQIFTSD